MCPAIASSGSFVVQDAFVRATPMKVSAGYGVIKNLTTQEDRLIKATADWAGRIELHTIEKNTQGVLQMTQVPFITVPASGATHLAPGGYHLMLYELKKPLEVGQVVTITLHFKQSGSQAVDFKVQPITYQPKKKAGI